MTLQLNTIHHGDCLQLLPQIAPSSVDFVLTDPPYITNYKPRDRRTIINDDNDAWLHRAFARLYPVLKENSYCVSFYGYPKADAFVRAFTGAGFRIVGHLVFPKPYVSNSYHVSYQHECAYLLAKGEPRKPDHPISDVIPWDYSGNRLHPTQKPLSVLYPLISAFCPKNGLVMDPFSGSGSSLVAAKVLGCKYLGIELDATYYDASVKRLAAVPPAIPR